MSLPADDTSLATPIQPGERFSYGDASVNVEVVGAGHSRETWSRSKALCLAQRG
jgi:hypothetical protein